MLDLGPWILFSGGQCQEDHEVSWKISKSYQSTDYVESPGVILGTAPESVNVNRSGRPDAYLESAVYL